MTMKTVTLSSDKWNDIMQLVSRGESDLAEYVPHYAAKDGHTPEEVEQLERLLKNKASADLSEQLADDSAAPATRSYTAFCHDSNGIGTIWIATVEVPIQDHREDEQQEAAYQARCECAKDWGRHIDESPREDISKIVCMGLIEGDVSVAMWDDTHLE